MADPNILNEFAALASGNIDLSEHTNNLLEVLKQAIQKTYLDKFDAIMDEYKGKSKNQMTDQIKLIEAMKPFFADNQQQQIDNISEMLMSFSALQQIAEDIQLQSAYQAESQNQDVSGAEVSPDLVVNEDAVYEIDNDRYHPGMFEGDGLMFILMLFFLFR